MRASFLPSILRTSHLKKEKEKKRENENVEKWSQYREGYRNKRADNTGTQVHCRQPFIVSPVFRSAELGKIIVFFLVAFNWIQ